MKTLLSLLLLFSPSAYAQSITLKGSVFDNHTHRFLPVKVFSINGFQKELLGSTVQEDVFEHRYKITVPLNTDSLLFEITGRPSLCLPVYFHGTFEKNSAGASLGIELPATSEEISQRAYSLLTQPEKGTVADNEFKLHFFHGDRYGYTGNLSRVFENSGMSIPNDVHKMNSKYKLTITSPKGELLTQNEFSPRPGINIVDANIYPQEKIAVQETANERTPTRETGDDISPLQVQSAPVMHDYPYGIPPIFFDQSKYELKMRGIQTLDSLLDYLNHKSDSKISLKGFTDQVGDPTLNATLARYRAQVVARYLTGKGLNPDRINIQWDESRSQTLADTGLSRYRKVVIHEVN